MLRLGGSFQSSLQNLVSAPMASPAPETGANEGLRWQDLFIIEGSGLRTTLAAVVPLVVGQLTGNTGIGLLAAMGGLQVAFADFQGAKARTLLWGTFGSAALALLGALVSQQSAPVLVGAMCVVMFAMAMLAMFGEVAGNLGFVLAITYAFAQGRPVSWHEGIFYFWTIALGGVWASLLTLLLWKLRRSLGDRSVDESPTGAAKEIGAQKQREAEECSGENVSGGLEEARPSPLTSDSPLSRFYARNADTLKHAVRVALATSIAEAICLWWHPPHGFWIILTTMVILKPIYHNTKGRFAQRLLGTIAGGLIAMIPAAYLHNIWALDALLVVFGVLAFSHLPRNYGLYVVFLTPFVVLLSAIAEPGDAQAALARITETILGGVVAFSIAFLLRHPSCYFNSQCGEVASGPTNGGVNMGVAE